MSATAALAIFAMSCTTGTVVEQDGNRLAYDPSLTPSEIYFDPNAKWATGWEQTPPPAKPQKSFDMPVDPNGVGEQVPWAVVVGRQVAALPPGVRPIEVMPTSVTVAETEFASDELPASVRKIRASLAKNASFSTPSTPARRPASSTESVPVSLPAADTIPVVAVVSTYPLENSLAVDAPRVDAYHRSYYNWEVPRVAQESFLVDGVAMNAYFFVRRRGESWYNLSTMIYGSAERHEDLRRWNQDKPLKVGTVMYYNSPFRPEDRSGMIPIAKDFGQKFERVRSIAGEPLTLLAKRHYGEWRVWKEIAYFNSIQDPDDLTANTSLTVQPRSLGHLLKKSRVRRQKVRVPTSTNER